MADRNLESAAEELKASIKKDGPDASFKHYTEILDNWRNVPVKLAVTGKSGVGKSSFINEIRCLKKGDKDFAPISSYGNTTTKPTIYRYPGNPKITLHDLPGFGTTEFPKDEYEEKMELHQYDYVLIFVGNIEENDIEIAKKLKEMDKPICFVRSQIDRDFDNARHDSEPTDEVIKKIKSKSLYILEQNGFKEAMFFAISTRDRRIGQFDELVSYIQSNLPELKSKAVNISMVGVLPIDLIDRKYAILKDRIWKISVTSAGLAAVPVTGVDVVLNLALICKELWLYHKTFGFEQQIVMDIIKADYISQKLTSSSIVKIGAANEAMQQFLLIELGKLATLMAVQSAFDYILPIIGSLVSGLTAGGITYRLLYRVLDSCRDDAKLVYYHLRNK